MWQKVFARLNLNLTRTPPTPLSLRKGETQMTDICRVAPRNLATRQNAEFKPAGLLSGKSAEHQQAARRDWNEAAQG